MKKVFAIGFITLFALQFAGFYAYFFVRLLTIRQEMKAALALLPEDQLEKIRVYSKDYQSIDQEEGEIEINGKMYDIAKIEKEGDHYILFALHDESEDSLLSLLDEVVKRSNTDKKPVPAQLLQFFALQFIPVVTDFNLHPVQASVNFSFFYLNRYSSIECAIAAPPPRV